MQVHIHHTFDLLHAVVLVLTMQRHDDESLEAGASAQVLTTLLTAERPVVLPVINVRRHQHVNITTQIHCDFVQLSKHVDCSNE